MSTGWRVGGLLLLCTGCSPGLEAFSQFKDLRVLAMQASAPAILGNTPTPLHTAFTALVVDPRGGPVNYTWSFCPVQSTVACDDFADLLTAVPASAQPLFQALRAVQISGVATPVLDASGAPFYGVPPFDVSASSNLTAQLFGYYLATSVLNQGLGVWPTAILAVTNARGDTVIAEKRLVLAVQDFAALAGPLLKTFGISVCPTDGSPAPPGCLQISPAVPNSNPVFVDLQASPGRFPGNPFAPISAPLQLGVGQSVRLLPSFTPASAESYQSLQGSLQTRTLQVENKTEALSVSWFCDLGTLQHALTWPLFTKDLANTYPAPATVPDGGFVTLWLVGRDQRGGETWRSLRIQITHAP